MPILPPSSPGNYDAVSVALTMAKVRLNEQVKTIKGVSGLILESTNAFTQQSVNNAWRGLQDYLGDRGYQRLISEVVIGPLPVVASIDPAAQCWLGWDGFFDGNDYFQTPRFPSGFSHPLRIWERQSGINQAFPRDAMEKILDGMPSSTKTTGNGMWEWREDRVYIPGSLMPMDLRIRFIVYLSDFIDVGTTQWFQQPIPIMRCADSLSWYIAAEYVSARGDDEHADLFWTKGKAAAAKVFNNDVRADQRVSIRRQPSSGYGHRGSGGFGWW